MDHLKLYGGRPSASESVPPEIRWCDCLCEAEDCRGPQPDLFRDAPLCRFANWRLMVPASSGDPSEVPTS